MGCISRLEAIRSTRPFAVVVEEASEVLEPLLFSCFVSSTVPQKKFRLHVFLAIAKGIERAQEWFLNIFE